MRALVRELIRFFLHALVDLHWLTIRILNAFPRTKGPSSGKTVLLTGTFFSRNWITNHLRPLALSSRVKKVIVVTTFPIEPISKVDVLYPPENMVLLIGDVPARLLYFVMYAFRYRPDLIGGFHLLLNGLLAAFLARIINAKSLYFCGGGPREVQDGGIHGSRLFSLIGRPDPVLERKLIRAVNAFDVVITMGPQAITFFEKKGVNTCFEVIPGGIDRSKFIMLEKSKKEYDCILVGRLEQVKRVDLFLEVINMLKKDRKTISAVIVGTGSLQNDIEKMAENLGVAENVTFAGYQPRIEEWLFCSKVFVLTSDSEGLSLALMEAMTCGLPSVVSDVGELGELVEHGRNGFLVKRRMAEEFSRYVAVLLDDQAMYDSFSRNARTSSAKHELQESAKRWDKLLASI